MRKLLLLFLTPALLAAQTPAKTPAPKKAAPTSAPTSSQAKEPKAIFHTTAGNITCTLFPDKAPLTVANFIGLATGKKEWTNPVTNAKKTNTPLYDGTIFHRVIPNFMIQGGDPAGNGSGNPGYFFRDEFSDLTFDQPGRLAMANSGPNTNGSQFFITEVPTPHLNGRHTIFGQCEPISIVQQIARMPRDPATDRPFNPVRITHLQIVQPGAAAATTRKAQPTTHRKVAPKRTTPKK